MPIRDGPEKPTTMTGDTDEIVLDGLDEFTVPTLHFARCQGLHDHCLYIRYSMDCIYFLYKSTFSFTRDGRTTTALPLTNSGDNVFYHYLYGVKENNAFTLMGTA